MKNKHENYGWREPVIILCRWFYACDSRALHADTLARFWCR